MLALQQLAESRPFSAGGSSDCSDPLAKVMDMDTRTVRIALKSRYHGRQTSAESSVMVSLT